MRKGRSQRKTRGSLPPTTKRPQSRPNVGGAGCDPRGPQVVVGLTAPRSEESFETRSEGGAPLETLSTRAAESGRLELVREKSLEIVRESLELVREELQEREAQLEQEPPAEIESAPAPSEPSEVRMRAETLSFDTPEGFYDAPDSEEAVTVRPSGTVNAESFDAHESSPLLPVARVHGPLLTLPTPDEMSIPPVGDLSVEPIADRFFSEGELVAARNVQGNDESEEWDQRAHKSVRKSLPEVVQRRARFAKYVRWAVGGAAVVCLAALARTALPPSATASGEHAFASRASLDALPPAPPVSPVSPASAEGETPGTSVTSLAPPVAKAAAAEVAAAEPVKAPESVAAPVVAVPTVETEKAANPEPPKAPEPSAAAPATAGGDEKTALQEKNDSRRALERGKVGDAIAAGERSVALDPTDGEAWLLLGAAYQEKGNNAEARRCYSSCIKDGKRGPLGECRAMLR